MELEKVNRIFEEHGEVFLKALRFQFNRIAGKFPDSQAYVKTVFQEQFVTMLKTDTTIADICNTTQRQYSDNDAHTDCEVAEEYFFDLLHPEILGPVPKSVAEHLKVCRHCPEKFIDFSKAVASDLSRRDRDYVKLITDQLIRHFLLLNMEVDCHTVREFLPLLLIADSKIEIPTPVTAHIDQCPQCFLDSMHLDRLKLTDAQLSTLSNFYSKHIFSESPECSQADNYIASIARFDYRAVPERILKHSCLCKRCRKLVRDEWVSMSQKLAESQAVASSPCDRSTPGGLFDYCLPFGFDPASDSYAKFREFAVNHLSSCRPCLDRIIKMDWILYGIAQQDDSGITTLCTLNSQPIAELSDFERRINNIENADELDEDTQLDLEKTCGDYERFGLDVKVMGTYKDKLNPQQAAKLLNLPAEMFEDKPVTVKIEQHLKRRRLPILAAAASIIFVIGLLSYLLTPSAAVANIELSDIYKAAANIKNVCISFFHSGEDQPWRQRWISQSLRVGVVKTGDSITVTDLIKKTKITKAVIGNTPPQIADLQEKEFLVAQEMMNFRSLLLPFKDLSNVPKDAKFTEVADADVLAGIKPGIKIYDLVWNEKGTDGSLRLLKWRGYIDNKAKLPVKSEWWQKHPGDAEFVLQNHLEISYPSASEIQKLLNQ